MYGMKYNLSGTKSMFFKKMNIKPIEIRTLRCSSKPAKQEVSIYERHQGAVFLNSYPIHNLAIVCSYLSVTLFTSHNGTMNLEGNHV
jgi:hypothetical protein